MVESRGIWTSMKNFVVKPSDFSGAKFASFYTVVEATSNGSNTLLIMGTLVHPVFQTSCVRPPVKYTGVQLCHFLEAQFLPFSTFIEGRSDIFQTFLSCYAQGNPMVKTRGIWGTVENGVIITGYLSLADYRRTTLKYL